MLEKGMYVRCAADEESAEDPRVFVCGQTENHNEFTMTVKVRFHDPFRLKGFFEDLPLGVIEIPEATVQRCRLFEGSRVLWKNGICKVLAHKTGPRGRFYYYLQDDDLKVSLVDEGEIIASSTNGEISPDEQLKNYEFQNPVWYLGRSVVSRCMNTLDNSVNGFKELAGSKILLLPHQVNAVMRCLQEEPFRYMLADEVGMGKTVEAASIAKIFLSSHASANVLLIVPGTLEEQWKTELLIKFGIEPGEDSNHNIVEIEAFETCGKQARTGFKWDLVIVDEAHRCLTKPALQANLQAICCSCRNLLLLSATPVQQKKDEYLALLRLLHPDKYLAYDADKFGELLSRQGNVIQRASLVLDDLDDLETTIEEVRERGEDPHENEECQDLFEEVLDGLEKIGRDIQDPGFTRLIEDIDFEYKDLGVRYIKVAICYVCGNYQVESSIIRNRRKMLEDVDGERLLPIRELQPLPYRLDPDLNYHEANCYRLLTAWIEESGDSLDRDAIVKPLIGSFFSSSWSFLAQVKSLTKRGIGINPELATTAQAWADWESMVAEDLPKVIDDPFSHEAEACTRLFSVIDHIDENTHKSKVVLFTNYPETFEGYRAPLERVFGSSAIGFFGTSIPRAEAEVDVYRFQNDRACRILLCDQTGGEGRNLQCADYVVHIDLPWDANTIEQRIGRLDRLERDPERPIVHSVVPFAENTIEEALFKFWSEGLKIFTESLSGMEIVMGEIDAQLSLALSGDFKSGLFDMLPEIICTAEKMREGVRKEQNFDAAGLMYRPLYKELSRLVENHAEHESKIFANAMMGWASLAGFNGRQGQNGTVTYSRSSFSPRSAVVSRLIPPNWDNYLNSSRNSFESRIQAVGDRMPTEERSIRGTFERRLAIGNDYLHFFSPGDEVFDCIVENSMQSCKGRSAAFAVPSVLNWKGLIFTWKLEPDRGFLLDKGLSPYSLGTYRSSASAELETTLFPIDNPEDATVDVVFAELARITKNGYRIDHATHLGKRSLSRGGLSHIIEGKSNVDWFKAEYPSQTWEKLVELGKRTTEKQACTVFKRVLQKSERTMKREMERALSAKMASDRFYGSGDGAAAMEKKQEAVLDAIMHSKVTLDSACFIWFYRVDHE